MAKETNTDRITRMEERQSNMASDIDEIKTDIKEIKDFMFKLDNRLEKKFFTRLEGRVIQTVLSVTATLIGLYFLLKDHLK